MITPHPSWLARRNPTVKAVVLLVMSLATLLITHPVPAVALYGVTLVVVVLAARPSLRALLLGQLPFVSFGVGLVMVNALTRPGVDLLPHSPVRVTAEGLSMGVALAVRGLVIAVATIGFLASTPPRDLMVSLVEHARLSPRYAYAILAGHRMLLQMPQTWATITAAQAVRAPLDRKGRPRPGLRGWARCAFALLVSSVRSAERISLALETRGLGAGPRSVWHPVPLRRSDGVFALVTLAAFAALVWWGMQW